MERDELATMWCPKVMVPFRHQSILFTIWKWSTFGFCMYTIFTTNKMSGLVIVWYWSEPTRIIRWKETSAKSATVSALCSWTAIGVEIGLQLDTLAFCSNYWTYLCWERNNLCVVSEISMPKKLWTKPKSVMVNSDLRTVRKVSLVGELPATSISTT